MMIDETCNKIIQGKLCLLIIALRGQGKYTLCIYFREKC